MSTTTLPKQAAKQPKTPSKASKKPSKPKTPPSSQHLLPRCIAGPRASTIPELQQHPDFTRKNVNDAKVILMAILHHASYWQVTKKLVRADTGFSDKRTTKALNYLRIQQMLANVVIRKDSKFHGWCFRVDLDGKVQKGGWVLHYSQETDVKRDFNARKQMRREKGGIDKPKPKKGRTRKPKAQKNDLSQYPPKQGGTDTAPLHSYNVIPVEAAEKEAPFIPASGENFHSLPGDTPATQELPQEPSTMPIPAAEPQGCSELPEQPSTTDPVRRDVLEFLEDQGFPCPDPGVAPTYYAMVALSVDAPRAPDSEVQWLGSYAIGQLQQGPRPRKEAALRWFTNHLPGMLLRDCLKAGEFLTVTAAHRLVRKLHQGVLTIDHFARYWAAVKTNRCKRQPLDNVVQFLQHTFSVKCERDAEWVTSAAARVHDDFGAALYRESMVRPRPWNTPETLTEDGEDTSRWSLASLCGYVREFRPSDLGVDAGARLQWSARIRVMAAVFGRENSDIALLLKALAFSGITKQDTQRWFVENYWGRKAFRELQAELGEKFEHDLFAELGLNPHEQEARVWFLWARMKTVRDSQENLKFPNMNLNDFCRH